MHPAGKLPASIHITAVMYNHRLICATYQKQLQSYEKYLTFARAEDFLFKKRLIIFPFSSNSLISFFTYSTS